MDNQKLILVGIIETKTERTTLRFIRELLVYYNYKIVYSNLKGNIIGFNNGIDTLLVMDIEPYQIESISSLDFKFDILLHTSLKDEDYDNVLIKDIFANCNYCILNSDEELWITLISQFTKGIVVTYGFNLKSTLTISSYDIDQKIKANLCLQREIYSLNCKRLEPHEFSIELDSVNIDDIYPVLAGATLSLVLGDEINIKDFKEIFKM